jgi:hypothetical protein
MEEAVMSILRYEIVFEKLAQAAGGETGEGQDYRAILREVDEVAELKRVILDMTEPFEQSDTTT